MNIEELVHSAPSFASLIPPNAPHNNINTDQNNNTSTIPVLPPIPNSNNMNITQPPYKRRRVEELSYKQLI